MLTYRQQRLVSKKLRAINATQPLAEPLALGWLSAHEQPKTGCWTFRNGGHVIKINSGCDAVASRSTKSLSSFAAAIAVHEFAHAKHTERDFKAMNESCHRAKCHFRLLNLFEDARIESLFRSANQSFKWLRWEKPISPSNPTSLLLALIQKEVLDGAAEFAKIDAHCIDPTRHLLTRKALTVCKIAKRNGAPIRAINIVWTFYVEILRCATTAELEPLLTRWMELFPATTGQQIVEDAAGTHNADQIAPDEVSWNDNGEPPEVQPPLPPAAESSEKTEKNKHMKPLKADELVEGLKIANLMSRAFNVRGESVVSTLSASKRLNIRDLAVGRIDKPFRKKVQTERGVPHVSVVVDFSGSMQGEPSKNSRVMLYALNKLAQDGKIRCHAYACRSGNGCYTEQAMPATPQKLSWEAVGGGEGIKVFFDQKMSEIASTSDCVIVLTDGSIGDTGTNFNALHSRGVFVVGAYVNNLSPATLLDQQRYLATYFDKGFARPDMQSMASDLASHISR